MSKGIIYIRMNHGSHQELLSYQEDCLEELSDETEIDDVIFDIGVDYQYHQEVKDRLEWYIFNKLIDYIFIYSPIRISSDPSVVEEFEMLCTIHGIEIIYYQDYRIRNSNE